MCHRGTSIDSGALGSSPLSINFEDVTFAYPLRPDLNVLGPHFSLSVRPGEVLAIVGGSGSGKSTIAGLLTRLYDLDNDTIGSAQYGEIAFEIPCIGKCLHMLTNIYTSFFWDNLHLKPTIVNSYHF